MVIDNKEYYLFTKQQKDIWANDILKLNFLDSKISKLENLYNHCDSLILALNEQITLKDKQIEINNTKINLYDLNETIYKERIEKYTTDINNLNTSLKKQTKKTKFYKITTIVAPLIVGILFLL